ncbi:hypothetical protein F4820DRAFT_445009 [Hypoxylon rubiginosum]|uniref:Uncharacterized protein n=1 Tax=Hypoxylon rubiginosum TaxID=110542 RepID=A0ACB9Z9T5_9PEZI|nr:hypothetical protein F4820DRAFT_445009 [Hypoxylon rubiginosum]
MQVTSLFTSVMAFAGLAAAAGNAIITIEASHGGAGSGLTNTTISVPIGEIYTGNKAMETVSTLYLVGTTGDVALDSVTCTPYKANDATGSHGLPFTSKTPSYLSTNTVVVGSILCTSS